MERERMTEMLTTRAVEGSDNNLTLGRNHAIPLGEYAGTLSVEYKPNDYRLAEDAFEEVGAHIIQNAMYVSDGEPRPEHLVDDVFWALVDVLYPEESFSEAVVERVPMLIEYEYSASDHSEFFVSAGTIRG